MSLLRSLSRSVHFNPRHNAIKCVSSQHRSFVNTHRNKINISSPSCSTYKYLSSTYKPSGMRRYSQQQFISPYQFHHPLVYNPSTGPVEVHSTTIICVRKDDEICMMGDGQMTIGTVVAKPNGRKLRKLNNEKAVCGFAGKFIIYNNI